MKKRLYITALITAPIIAIYDSSPLYIFKIIDFNNLLIQVGGLTIDAFLFWIVHIFFERKFPNQNIIARFIATFLINTAIRGATFLTLPNEQLIRAHIYIAYPVISYLALNAIIMVMVQSIVTGYKKAEAEKQLQELKWQNAEAQMQVLMQQLQPHFLFNALSTLKSLIKEAPEQAEVYTLKLSEFLRYTVQSQSQQLISIEKELKFVDDYINLLKIRFGVAFNCLIEIAEPMLQKKIPVLALQILVENIFKHNYFTERKPLYFSITNSNNTIVVWNKKTSEKLTEKNKTGLSNLNRRFQLICNKGIEVTDAENEFRVTIPVLE